MTNYSSSIFVLLLITYHVITTISKPMLLSCDTYATSSTCTRSSTSELGTDCETCCNALVERMFDCPPCRYFLLNGHRQGSSCFCTVCFKPARHRRRHHHTRPFEQDSEIHRPPSRFD